MGRTIDIPLTDELHAFLLENSGHGTAFSTPSEFVLALIQEKKEQIDRAALCKALLEGYEDVRHGRTREYTGDLRTMLIEFRNERERT